MTENPYSAPESDVSLVKQAGDSVIPGLNAIKYPLTLSFKIVALAPQLSVTDATGREVMYIKQKLFKFKEKVEIFRDSSKTEVLGRIQANKVIDWSARYFFETSAGEAMGSVGRKGMRSLWKASYEVFSHGADAPEYKISEENPMAKVFDSLLGEVPILGLATAYLFNPRYGAVGHASGKCAMKLTKQPALLARKFQLDKLEDLSSDEESSLLFSFMMLVLLERARG